ncbi:pantoate--beta-alanine ligase [Thiomicrorhabdus sp.]|uniref:pantoate--beta-alanine ligase n=1 Tax=Thiomicrorhabdus sp. TaxID=2039724 RepID=UPI0029C62C3A|nr:pantoate--beta-alanine ligase [Thiomicrorhabdus sp.]
MIICNSLAELDSALESRRRASESIGFVPTMGNLHQGHLSLVNLAREHCGFVVVSVFVNPMQFGPDEDYERYPRTFEADAQALEKQGADILFVPREEEVYPNGFQDQTRVCAPAFLTEVLEGQSRPGHFDGVTTIVMKLFQLVRPDVAVFGQKDFQQLKIIQRMVTDLNMPIEILPAQIAREHDGLALSSRNQYLNTAQRAVAPVLQRVLKSVEVALRAGERAFDPLCLEAEKRLLSAGFEEVDYLKICDPETLRPSQEADRRFVILAVARLGTTRLLDNICLEVS